MNSHGAYLLSREVSFYKNANAAYGNQLDLIDSLPEPETEEKESSNSMLQIHRDILKASKRLAAVKEKRRLAAIRRKSQLEKLRSVMIAQDDVLELLNSLVLERLSAEEKRDFAESERIRTTAALQRSMHLNVANDAFYIWCYIYWKLTAATGY